MIYSRHISTSLTKSILNKNGLCNTIITNNQLILNNSMMLYNQINKYMFSKQNDNIKININTSTIFNNNNKQQNHQQNPINPSKSTQSLPTFSQLQLTQLLSQTNPLLPIILDHIHKFGEMKLQKYWNIALTDSEYGYYSNSNVFSKQGDFTTSPQISSLFGQMISVWLVYFLNKIGILDQNNNNNVNKKFRIIQFGPGRGLLMRDILKSLHDMKIDNYFQISFVQVSQYNRKCQQQHLFEQFKKYDSFFKFQYQNQNKQIQLFTNQSQFKDIQLKWFNNFQVLLKEDYDKIRQNKQLPATIFLMNQYFDALPTNVLEYTQNGWRQKVLVKGNKPEFPLQLKNSSVQIPEKMRPNIKDPKIGDKIQISHQSLITMDTMCKLLLHTKGAILNIDYGGQVNYSNSIRAIKNHKFIPHPYFWQIPGKCDLSAYVNFAGLADFAQSNKGIQAFQTIPQGYFLQAMGINPRIQILQKNMNQKQKQRIQSEYHRLVHPQQMGEVFKVQCVTLKQYGEVYPWIEEKQGEY